MSVLSFLRQKTVLITTDDAVEVFTSVSGSVTLVAILAWEDEEFSARLYRLLKKECKSRPITVLNDMVEQHYRKERVMKAGVGIFDRENMIRRKLMAAFPNYPIRAALPLKEKDAKQNVGSYIFVAIPGSEKINKLIQIIRQPEFTVDGLYLLPVESTDMVRALSDKLLKRSKEKKTGWTIFIGQHKGGGLRQVVTRNGELALTRITPVSDMYERPENWVLEAHQEFKATMSYLARFGYEASDGLNVVVIAGDECGMQLEQLITEECVYDSITLEQAASYLGLKMDTDLGDNYADILHAAWATRKSSLVLPMAVPVLEELEKPRKIATYASLLLMLGALFFGYQAFTSQERLIGLQNDIQQASITKTQLQEEYEEEVRKKAALGYDIKLLQGSLDIHARLEKNKPDVLALFKEIGQALEGNIRFNKVSLQKPKNDLAEMIENARIPSEEEQRDVIYRGKLTIIYPSTTDINRGNTQIRELRNRLNDNLPDHHFQVTKFLNDYEYTEQVVVESSTQREQQAQQDYVIEITFRKDAEEEGGEE